MRRRTFVVTGGAMAAGLAAWHGWPRQDPLPQISTTMAEQDFEAIRAVVRPAPGEDPFVEIPWQTSLWDARVLAAREGKPILLWEMDGHPLGCG